jgi:hypothetical protein
MNIKTKANAHVVGVTFLALLFLVAVSWCPAGHAEFKAGAALRVVTPDPLLPVSGGVGAPNPSTQKMGDLFARAMVFEQDGTRVALVCLDFLGWPNVLGDRIRAQAPGIPAENILIGVTHTHSAPDAYAFADEKGNHGADLDYLDWVCNQAAAAVNEALDSLEPAALKINVDAAKGKIAYNYYGDHLFDPRCSVLQAIATSGSKKGKAIGTLVNYASHPEVIGNSRGILTPDFCGPLYSRIEEKTGGMALYMNGAQGGMVTADNRTPDGKDSGTWKECVRIGELLADEALRIVEDAPLQEEPALYCAAKTVNFPIESPLMMAILKNSPLGFEVGAGNSIPTRLNLINIGTAQMLTIPGEALPNIGSYLKQKMPTDDTFLLGLTNDALGYILVKEDFYAYKRYNYISRTSLGEKTGEILVEKSLEFIAESPKPTKK